MEKSRQSTGEILNFVGQLRSGERFASWIAVALYRFGAERGVTLINRLGGQPQLSRFEI